MTAAHQTQLSAALQLGACPGGAPAPLAGSPTEQQRRSFAIADDSTRIVVDPDIPEAALLKEWWAAGGSAQPRSSGAKSAAAGGFRACKFEERKTLQEVKGDTRLGTGAKPDYVNFKACLAKVRTDRLWYQSCGGSCGKKVTENPDGSFTCEKCQTTKPECEHRYLVSALFCDETGEQWVSAFNETGITIFGGKTADELAVLKDENADALEDFISKQCCFRPFLLRCSLKNEVWQEQSRVKTRLVAVKNLDFAEESRELIKALTK